MIHAILAPAVAVGLVLIPLAAQAGTTHSASAGPGRLAPPGARKSTSDDADRKLAPGLLVAVVVAAGAATYGHAKAINPKVAAKDD